MLNNNSSWQGFLLSSSMGAFPLLAWLRSGSSQGWWKINMLVDSEDITDGITYIRYIVPWQMKAGGQEPVMGHMTHNQMSGWSRWWARYFYQAVRMVDIDISEKTIVCLPLFTNICVCRILCVNRMFVFRECIQNCPGLHSSAWKKSWPYREATSRRIRCLWIWTKIVQNPKATRSLYYSIYLQ